MAGILNAFANKLRRDKLLLLPFWGNTSSETIKCSRIVFPGFFSAQAVSSEHPADDMENPEMKGMQ